jgi:hypothetical protein
MTVCDLGCASSVVCAERFRTGAKSFTAGAHTPAALRGYWRALEPSLVRAELADRALRTRSPTRAHADDSASSQRILMRDSACSCMLIMINEPWLLEPYFLLGRRPLLGMSGRQLDCPAGRQHAIRF